jgi:hypothetical protein
MIQLVIGATFTISVPLASSRCGLSRSTEAGKSSYRGCRIRDYVIEARNWR